MCFKAACVGCFSFVFAYDTLLGVCGGDMSDIIVIPFCVLQPVKVDRRHSLTDPTDCGGLFVPTCEVSVWVWVCVCVLEDNQSILLGH